jgi:predicted PurR-regulated permease PerM
MALGMRDLLVPPLAATVIVYLLLPYADRPWGGRTIMVVILLGLVWTMTKVHAIVWIAGLGLFTAYLLNPAVGWLQARGISRPRAALYLFLSAMIVTAAILAAVLPVVYDQTVSFVTEFPAYLRTLWERYGRQIEQMPQGTWPIDLEKIRQNLLEAAQKVASNAGHQLITFGKLLGFFLSILFITPIVAYHFLKDLPTIRQGALRLIPSRHESEVNSLFQEMDVLIGGWLRGQLIVSTIVGILTMIGLSLLRIPYGIFLGLVAGLLNMVPILGYWISLGLTLVVVLASGFSPGTLLIVLALFFGIQLLEQNLLSPKILGTHTGLHPVAILLALLVFGSLGGFAGALLAIPLTLFLRVFYRRYLERRWRGVAAAE